MSSTFVEKENLQDIVGNYVIDVDPNYFPKIKSQSAKAIFPVSNCGEFMSCFIIFYDKNKKPIDGELFTKEHTIKKLFDVFTDHTNLCFK